MAIKILALDGLNDQKLCSLIVQLIQTIPSVQSASIDYLSQKLTLQIKDSERDITKTISEVSLALKENIPGVSIKLAAVVEAAPKAQSGGLNFSKERALLREKEEEERLREEERIKEEERLQEEERLKEEERIKEEKRKEEEEQALKLAEEQKEANSALRIKKLPLKKETKSRIFGLCAAAGVFLVSLAFQGNSLLSLIFQIGAFLFVAILTLISPSPKNGESTKYADIFAVCAAGIAFFWGSYIQATAGLLIYAAAILCVGLIYDRFYFNLSKVIDIKPEKVVCTRNGVTELLTPSQVIPGDNIVIDIGHTIPFDGIVTDGKSMLDRSLFSGTDKLTPVEVGGSVSCGEINVLSQITVCVLEFQAASFATRVYSMLMNSPIDNAKTTSELRKMNTYFMLSVLLCTVVLGLLAFDKQGLNGLLSSLPIYLLILLPCGAVPTASLCFLSGVGRALKHKIIVTTSRNLDLLARAKNVVFGYSGVLTKGEYEYVEVLASEENNNEEVMEAAAYAEHSSSHPIAKKILEQYTELYNKKVIPSKIGFSEAIEGGVKALVDLRITLVGSAKLMRASEIEIPPNEEGKLHVYVSRFGKCIGTIVFNGPLKGGAEEIASELKSAGVSTVGLLTGCDSAVAQTARKKLNFDAVYSEQNDSDKLATILTMLENPDTTALFIGNEADSEVFAPLCPTISMGNSNLDTLLYFSAALIPSNDVKTAVKAVTIARTARRSAFFNMGIFFFCKAALIALVILLKLSFLPTILIDIAITAILILAPSTMINRK